MMSRLTQVVRASTWRTQGRKTAPAVAAEAVLTPGPSDYGLPEFLVVLFVPLLLFLLVVPQFVLFVPVLLLLVPLLVVVGVVPVVLFLLVLIVVGEGRWTRNLFLLVHTRRVHLGASLAG